MSKVTVIGAGNVGATIVNDLMVQGVASELLLIDINKKKAFGEAMDIYQGVPFCVPANVHSGDYEDAADSDVVIVTSGMPRKPGMSRLDLAQTNVDIMKDIAPKITAVAPNAIYLIVANPVDILTYAFIKYSGLPARQVIGSGTILDTNRLQSELARRFCVSPKNVHAHVYGEHGDTSFVPWSLATIANNHIDIFRQSSPDKDRIPEDVDYREVEEFVRKSGAVIIENKGATYFAVAISVCHLCKCVLNTAPTAATVSVLFDGEYGIDDVCLSALALIDKTGCHGIIKNPLTEEEQAKLRHSANTLKEIIAGIEF